MRNQSQNEDQITPWGFDQNIPNNIVIQYIDNNKCKQKQRNNFTDRKNMKLSSNFNRFLQKRQLKISQKMVLKLQQQQAKLNNPNTKKLQITNIQPPQSLFMNETFRLSEMFPSFSLNRVEKGLTLFKRKHFSIQKSQHKEQSIKMLPLRYSVQSDQQQNTLQLTRQLTAGQMTYHFSKMNKSFRDKGIKSSICKKSMDSKEQLNKSLSNEIRFAKLQKSNKKSKRYQDIIQYLQKKKQKSKLEKCKTDEPVQLDKCLKSKKQFYYNLPKIQFIQISQ